MNNKGVQDTVKEQARQLEDKVVGRTKELHERVAGLEGVRKAMTNLLEDLGAEQKALTIAKAKDEALLESIGEGVIATDQYGKVIIMNKVAEGLLAIPSRKIIGKSLIQKVPLQDAHGAQIADKFRPITLALTLGASTTNGVALYYVRPDKQRLPLAMTVTPVKLEGKTIGTIEVFRDITKETEIDRAKTEFISLASHQLKTPATAINWLTERILKGRVGKLTPKLKEYFNDIRTTNLRMIELVNALLNVSRIELGAFSIEPANTDISGVVKRALRELKSSVDQKRLSLKQTYPKEYIVVSVDKPLFLMVINNLVMNAIQYTPACGNIQVECQRVEKGQKVGGRTIRGDSVLISVRDTGCGIPTRQQGKIFTKFFRADNAKEKCPDGTGLGLYMVKSILDHSGGAVWFVSQENKGATFYIAIPLGGMKEKTGALPLIMPQVRVGA